MSGDVVKVGQVWKWGWDDEASHTITIVGVGAFGVRYQYGHGLSFVTSAGNIAANATLVTEVPDPEPTPLDALAAAAVAYENACNGDDKHWTATAIRLEQAATAYARSVRG